MKYYNLLLLFLIAGVNSSTSAQIKYFEKSEDSYLWRGSSLVDHIVLHENNSFLILSKSRGTSESISHESYPEVAIPIHASNIDDSNALLVWSIIKDSSFLLQSTSYSLKSGVHVGIDSIEVSKSIEYLHSTSTQEFENGLYFWVSGQKSGNVSDIIGLIKMTKTGEFKKGTFLEHELGDPREGVFNVNVVHSHVVHSNNAFIVAGLRPYVVMVDSSLQVIHQLVTLYDHPSKNERVLLLDPFISKAFGGEIIGSCGFPFGLGSFSEEIFFTLSIDKDSVVIDTAILISNIEAKEKAYVFNLSLGDNSVITGSNELYNIGTLKPSFPSHFYLTRLDDNREVWHKSFGGDHYYRLFDMTLIDSCKILVTGSVFDYFNNGYVQGFYALFDCDGTLVTSNVELEEIEFTLYPNPASDVVYILNTGLQGKYQIRLISENGSIINYEEKILKLQDQIIYMLPANISNGMYYIQFQNKRNDTIYSQAFLVTK